MFGRSVGQASGQVPTKLIDIEFLSVSSVIVRQLIHTVYVEALHFALVQFDSIWLHF